MKLLLKGADVFISGSFKKCEVAVDNGRIIGFLNPEDNYSFDLEINLNNKVLLPGLIDVHTHLREPGFFYKESIKTGTAAAARSGYSDIFAMPNLNPCPDSRENIMQELEIIRRDAVVNVHAYAAITEGEKGERLVDFAALAPLAAAFSDDGKGVQNADTMRKAMLSAKKYGKIIAAHCEDERLVCGGCIHDGSYAAKHGLKGISSASEYIQVERDLALAEETGVKYHVCHVSTKESVELIRRAKARGVDVTCETAPHYLLLTDADISDDGRFKMNPPLREESDKRALIDGIKDGTVDMIATDHAPHSAEEKSRGLAGSLMGITGLETAFPMLYTGLVKKGIITLEKLVELMSVNPSRRFGIESAHVGGTANFAAFELDKEYTIDSAKFASKGKCTPFDGERVFGKCVLNIVNGRTVWQDTTEK